MSTAQQIRVALERALAPLGLVVEDVSVSMAGKRGLVRVLVDTDISGLDIADTASPVPHLSLDAVADATRAVSDELDSQDLLGDSPYVLEVSSPGIGRALATRDQFRRQVGRLVEVAHADGSEKGRIVEVGADTLTLEIPATKQAAARIVTIVLEAVERGTVQVEFTHHEGSSPDSADEPTHDGSGAVDEPADDLSDSKEEN